MARQPDPGTRERILTVATRLFSQHGVHAVGLQQIIDACGCGKNVLYREFGSKDDLVVAFLENCRTDWAAVVEKAAASSPDPGRRLVAIVAATAEHALGDEFRGCPLRNAYAEFPDPGHPAHQVIVDHYTGRQRYLRELAREAGAADPDVLAARIALLIDGINANTPVMGENGAVGAAVAFAEEAVRVACPGHERLAD